VYAGASLRGLYADGAYFATKIAEGGFRFGHPARWVSVMIDEWPVAAAMQLGLQTPHSVGVVYSLVTNTLPGLLILLCFPALPASDRLFFIFPAFVYFAGTLSAQFASVTEGLIATPYFWLLFCLITFGQLALLRLALIAVLAAGTLHLHEETLFLGPVLVLACAMRLRRERAALPRLVLSVAALCTGASAVIGGYYVLYPVILANRAAFVSDFLSFRWLYSGGFNIPSILGLLASTCIVGAVLRPASGRAAIWVFAALSIPPALAAFCFDWLIAPYTQWAARNNAALMSLPLSLLLLVAREHPPLATAVSKRPVRMIVVLLGVTVSTWHVAATEEWSYFIKHFSNILQSRKGMIAWDIVVEAPQSRQAVIAWRNVWLWTNPNLSILALPRSCVNSIIENPQEVTSQPYVLSSIATMPALHGITYTYLLPPDQQLASCPVSGGSEVSAR
jgi:hypothetical protein